MIGSHLVRRLVKQGYDVVGVDNLLAGSLGNLKDIKNDFKMVIGDCRDYQTCMRLCKGQEYVWTFAANMGGITLITTVHADVLADNSLINLNMLNACHIADVNRMLYSSSACVYSELYQKDENVVPLKEEHAYPALPNESYGWEKLFTEQACYAYMLDYDMDIRIPRFHNVYGSAVTAFDEQRAKAPCKMILRAIQYPEKKIEIWNDGKQTRSFLYIDDCIDGIMKLMASDYKKPINIGSDYLISMNDLAQMVCKISGKDMAFARYPNKPQGVRGRNSDNTLVKQVLDWEPKVKLEDGLTDVYKWAVEHYNELEGI